MTLDGGGALVGAHHDDGAVFVSFRPSSVTLHRGRPDSSARNAWPVTVEALEQQGDTVRVALTGQPDLAADVTPLAVAELGLEPGTPGVGGAQGHRDRGLPGLSDNGRVSAPVEQDREQDRERAREAATRARGRKTVGDMVRSLAVVLVVVGVIVALNIAEQPDPVVRDVDYPAAIALARQQAAYDVLGPGPGARRVAGLQRPHRAGRRRRRLARGPGHPPRGVRRRRAERPATGGRSSTGSCRARAPTGRCGSPAGPGPDEPAGPPTTGPWCSSPAG